MHRLIVIRAIAFATLGGLFVERLTAQQPAGSQPSFPPTGSMIDVGGYRVHLDCVGSGRPTVMILGAGYSFDWSLVQGPASTFTRVCTYDPSGSAWSDPGPTPTCESRVSEIHRLLRGAGIEDSLILVGHSIGAVFARMYASRYPDEVRGLVLSDHAGVYRMTPPPTAFGASPSLPSSPMVRVPQQSVVNLPPSAQALHRWAASLPRKSNIALFNACIAQLDTSKASKAGALGDRPLVVVANMTLSGSEDYLKAQARFLALSRRSSAMVAATPTHDANLDDPESLVRAIRRVVDEVRKR